MNHTTNAVNVFSKYAREYQDRFMTMDMYNDSYDLFCDLVTKKEADILELASGPGNITRYVLKKRPDFNLLGTDLSAAMLELARENVPQARFQLMDCRDITKTGKKFDAIMCGFCLPYLSREDAVQLIADAHSVLNDGGILYISTMEDDYSKSGFKASSINPEDKVFVYYHQGDYLTEALDKNRFQLIHLHRQDFPLGDGLNATDLIMIAQK